MITQQQCEAFVLKVQRWHQLAVAEQDEVISRTLERFAAKGKLDRIDQPDRWLLRAAKLVEKEVYRETTAGKALFESLRQAGNSDRRVNGNPQTQAAPLTSFEDSSVETLITSTVREVLNGLSVVDRQIAELCGMAGLQPAEVGRRLSMPRSTVKSRWQRLRNKLSGDSKLAAIISVERTVA